jgi:alkylation response protein AidB-like acyl-CoA dehydrogenase
MQGAMLENDLPLVTGARAAAAAIAPLAARIEAERRLPAEAVSALVDAGVFKLLVPRDYGGSETTIATLLAVIETIARADGSAGWCAMIGAASGVMSAYLPEEVARTVYGPSDAISCGVFAPMGRAAPASGGYRVSGRWAFASGCEHSPWRMGGVTVQTGAADAPQVRSVLFRAEETRVIDTWDTSGLRGTGSHDLEVRDVLVPAERTFSLFEAPRHPGRLYRVPFFGVLAAGVAAVTLGIARAAVEAFIEVAKAKQPLGAKRTVAHREAAQLAVARAEGKVRAARALLFEAMVRLESQAIEGEASLEGRAVARIAASHAVAEAVAAVDLACDASGATAIYAKSPLERHFRDVHTAAQHVMVSATSATLAGRVLLGVETDTAVL